MEILMRKFGLILGFFLCFILVSILINNLTYGLSKALNISDDILFILGIIISFAISLLIVRYFSKRNMIEDESLGN